MSSITNFQALALGMGSSLILAETRDVLVFGSNSDGQLGVGDQTARVRPEFLSKSESFHGEDIVMVVAEGASSACV